MLRTGSSWACTSASARLGLAGQVGKTFLQQRAHAHELRSLGESNEPANPAPDTSDTGPEVVVVANYDP